MLFSQCAGWFLVIIISQNKDWKHCVLINHNTLRSSSIKKKKPKQTEQDLNTSLTSSFLSPSKFGLISKPLLAPTCSLAECYSYLQVGTHILYRTGALNTTFLTHACLQGTPFLPKCRAEYSVGLYANVVAGSLFLRATFIVTMLIFAFLNAEEL